MDTERVNYQAEAERRLEARLFELDSLPTSRIRDVVSAIKEAEANGWHGVDRLNTENEDFLTAEEIIRSIELLAEEINNLGYQSYLADGAIDYSRINRLLTSYDIPVEFGIREIISVILSHEIEINAAFGDPRAYYELKQICESGSGNCFRNLTGFLTRYDETKYGTLDDAQTRRFVAARLKLLRHKAENFDTGQIDCRGKIHELALSLEIPAKYAPFVTSAVYNDLDYRRYNPPEHEGNFQERDLAIMLGEFRRRDIFSYEDYASGFDYQESPVWKLIDKLIGIQNSYGQTAITLGGQRIGFAQLVRSMRFTLAKAFEQITPEYYKQYRNIDYKLSQDVEDMAENFGLPTDADLQKTVVEAVIATIHIKYRFQR